MRKEGNGKEGREGERGGERKREYLILESLLGFVVLLLPLGQGFLKELGDFLS